MTSFSNSRLITQNLLVSAAAHELGGKANWKSVRDLSVLIETFCLYDKLIVLGRHAYSMLEDLKGQSEIFKAVDLVTEVEDPAADAQLVSTTCLHLGAFLNEQANVDRFQPLIDSLFEPDSVERAFAVQPDEVRDFQSGEEWLRTVPDEMNLLAALERDAEFHRSATFLVRTFLYLAYADIRRLPLTPDQTRARVLEPIVRSERYLRTQLLEKLDEAFHRNYLGDDEVRRNITPLASVVFNRADSDPKKIGEEMLRLRRELSPLRGRLGGIETRLESGTHKDELEVARQWNRVFKEIESEHGEGEGYVSVEKTLSFAEAAGKMAAKPKDPGTWSKPLELPINAIRKLFARRPVVEIHKLQFPSTAKLQATARKLFGDLLGELEQPSQ